ncbi:MAG: T9SS type A sorting domain-containing protein [Prolixibacteraceae bacterium]
MKNSYLLLLLIFSISFSLRAATLETRIVKVQGWDPATNDDPTQFENLLYDAVMQDSTQRKTNPNVIFELNRDQIYFMGKQLSNYDFHLHIRGAEGEGLLPEIQGSGKSDGTYGLDYIVAYNDLTLENLAINGFLPDGGNQHWVIELRGNGSTVHYNNVSWDGDRAAAVCARADSLKIYIKDCTMGNLGYRTTFGGNGRMIDLRPEALYLDTLVIENSTTYNSTDRIIRNMNTHINYLYIDHLTAANTVGRHGGIQLGDCKNATIKNSIFANVIMLGHCDAHISEQTQPETPPRFAVITLDKIYADGSYVIENNNMFWDESVTGVWNQLDSVSVPDFVNPLIKQAVDADKVDQIYFSEPLSFTTMCAPQISYIALYYADPNAGTYPDSWCVGGDGGYFPDEIDCSYSTSSKSYTEAEGGLPVGNLNYFKGIGTSNKNVLHGEQRSIKAFPNPFKEQLTIAYQVELGGLVNLSVYDTNGRLVKNLINQNQAEGRYQIAWDGRRSDGSAIVAGMYIYRIETASNVNSGSIRVIR